MFARSIFAGLAAVLLAGTGLASDFKPTRFAFSPHLVVDNEPAVCAPFLAAVRREFFDSKTAMNVPFDIDVGDRDWPGASVRWLFPRNSSEAGFGEVDSALGGNHSSVEADLDGDGLPEILTLLAWVHSWRGYNYALIRHPNSAALEAALKKAASVDELALGATSAFDGVATSGLQSGAAWRWARPSVVEIGGAFYLVDLGEVYSRSEFVSLRRIHASGPLVEACRVVKWRGPDAITQRADPFQEFLASLRAIAGFEGSCGGTLVANAKLGLEQITVEALATSRPWALPDKPYNTRSVIDDGLKTWSLAGLWNYRMYRRMRALEPRAVEALARKFEADFGVSRARAEREARHVVDLVVRHRFIFPTISAPVELSERERLQALILSGGSPAKIDRLIQRLPSIGSAVQADHCSPGLEPLLFAALERPSMMRKVLDAGFAPDERNGFGKTPLMAAAHFDLLPAARMLVSRHVDVNARIGADVPYPLSITGRTALMYAAENASYRMIELLVRAGADVAAVDSAKHDVFDYLSRNTLISVGDKSRATALLKDVLSKQKPRP